MEMVKFKYTCKYCKKNVVISCTSEDAEMLKKVYETKSTKDCSTKMLYDIKRIVSSHYCRLHARSQDRGMRWNDSILDKLLMNGTITKEDGPVIEGCVIEKS